MWILSKAYVKWLYSREREAAYSADVFLIGEPSAQWNSTLTPRPSSSQGRTTVCSTHSLFGTMCAHLTACPGAGRLTLFPAASPVRTFRPRERERESTESAPDSGVKCTGYLAKFDLGSRSWRTAQCCFLGVSDEFSETWPKSGMMLSGQCWALTTSELHTNENGYGSSQRTPDGISFFHTPCTGGLDGGSNSRKALSKRFLTPMASEGLRSTLSLKTLAEHWRIKPKSNLSEQIAFETAFPTPTVSGNYNRKGASNKSGDGLASYVAKFPTPRTKGLCGGSGSYEALQTLTERGTISDAERRSMAAGNGGALNPTWVEWLMGWPIGWTDLGASATDKCRCARRQPSASSTNA